MNKPSWTDVQVVAIIATIIREVNGGVTVEEAVDLGEKYLREARSAEARGQI